MRRIFKYSLLFIALTILCYITVFSIFYIARYKDKPLICYTNGYLLWKGGDSYQKFHEFDQNQKHNTIILGSSLAYRGYDPRIFRKEGYDAFNLGSSNQSLLQSYAILTQNIKVENTKNLILDVNIEAFKTDGLESSADLIQNLKNEATAWKITCNQKDIRAFNMLFLRQLQKFEKPFFKDDDYVGYGFCETHLQLNSIPKIKALPNQNILDSQINYFRKILKYCMHNQLNLILVNHPKGLLETRSSHEKFIQIIEKELKDYDFEFIDYYNFCQLSTEDYYDEYHLNQNGVNKFNSYLIKELKQKNLLLE